MRKFTRVIQATSFRAIFEKIVNISSFFMLFSLFTSALAAKPTGLGAVADNLMTPVGLFSDFIYTGCLVIGGSFILAGVIKYIEHRRSPLFVPISTVIFLFVAGILLLLLPFSYLLIDYAPAYSLFRN